MIIIYNHKRDTQRNRDTVYLFFLMGGWVLLSIVFYPLFNNSMVDMMFSRTMKLSTMVHLFVFIGPNNLAYDT